MLCAGRRLDNPTQMEGRYARRAVCCRKGFGSIIEKCGVLFAAEV